MVENMNFCIPIKWVLSIDRDTECLYEKIYYINLLIKIKIILLS